MDMQQFMDMLCEAGERTRGKYHLTLGGLIDALGRNLNLEVAFDTGDGVGKDCSYRGYYSDLALDAGPIATCADLLKRLSGAIGKTYTGYKGGDYTMRHDTPLWFASYGNTGLAIVDAKVQGSRLVLVTKVIDD